MASQSELAAMETARAVDAAALQKAAPLLKKNYRKLQAMVPGLWPPEQVTDEQITALAKEVLEGKSDRAKKIRAAIPEEIGTADKIRSSAVKAVQDNTGDYEFLGGSTVGNALSGLGTWLFSGGNFFEKLGELFSFIFSGFDQSKMPEGLRKTIADGAVSNTVGEFKTNLQSKGVDISQGIGKDAVDQFTQSAQAKASGQTLTPAAPPDLSNVKMDALGITSAPKSSGDPKKDLQATFGDIVDSVVPKELVATLSDTDKKNLAAARKAFIDEGTALALANPALLNNKDAFAETLITKTKARLQKDDIIDPDPNKKPDPRMASMMDLMKSTIAAANPYIAEAATGKKLSPEEEKQAKAAQAEVAKQKIEMIKKEVTKKLNGSIDAGSIKANIDKAIKEKIATDYPTNSAAFGGGIGGWWKSNVNYWWVNDSTATLVGKAPSDNDREQLSQFMSTNLKSIMSSKINKLIDNGAKTIDVNNVTRDSLNDFSKSFDKAIADGTIPATWIERKQMIMDSIESKMTEQLAQQAPQINSALQTASAGSSKPEQVGFTMPNGTTVSPLHTGGKLPSESQSRPLSN